MAAHKHTPSEPYVHPADPAGWLTPGEPFMVDGFDWSWTFVIYKDVPRFPGYCAGTNGTVWSRRRGHGAIGLKDQWHRLFPTISVNVRYISLYLSRDGVKFRLSVHRIIAETFLGPCPPGEECCHFPDPDRRNCRARNLRWGTRQDNRADSKIHGTDSAGSRNGFSKLVEVEIPVIRWMLRDGIDRGIIASIFLVSRSTIDLIAVKKVWRHVPD